MQKLIERIQKTGSHLCVGLDPSFQKDPGANQSLKKIGPRKFLTTWSKIVLTSAAKKAPVVKFQSAYFEKYGSEGFAALEESIKTAQQLGFFVILDAKRGDIASTMEAYGVSAFEQLQADALTVSPYMGTDVLEPLVPWLLKGKGVFLVWVTSNASASNLQFSKTSSGVFCDAVFAEFRKFAQEKRVESQLGFVFGATKSESSLNSKMKGLTLLIPGIGAQGGALDAPLKSLLQLNPSSIYNVSRGITEMPPSGNDFSEEAFLAHCTTQIAKYL